MGLTLDPSIAGDMTLYAKTLLGATATYIFALRRGFKGATEFLQTMFPDRPAVFYDRMDFLLVSVIGSMIGFLFYAPQTSAQALAAGLGWVSAINVALKK